MNPTKIKISTELSAELIAYHLDCLPEEGCGLLAGKDQIVQLFLPVENSLHSPNRFAMKPEEQLKAFKQIEEQHLDLIAIVHSHPDGVTTPSVIDCNEFAYPGVLSVIIAPLKTGISLLCYEIMANTWTIIDIENR